MLGAQRQVGQCHLRCGEVDHHIEVIHHGSQTVAGDHTQTPLTGQLTDVDARQGAAGFDDARRQRQTFHCTDGLDQRASHASGDAHDCDTGHADSCLLWVLRVTAREHAPSVPPMLCHEYISRLQRWLTSCICAGYALE